MDNFKESQVGYDKQEVNQFVDYVIKKTEENILVIKNQREEIRRLQEELNRRDNMYFISREQIEEMRKEANRERERIIQDAKDNASRIVNDALLRANSITKKQELLNKNIYIYKKKIRNTLMEQLEALDDIELL